MFFYESGYAGTAAFVVDLVLGLGAISWGRAVYVRCEFEVKSSQPDSFRHAQATSILRPSWP